MFETVLFSIDQNSGALEPTGKVLELARRYGSRLVLLSVLQPASAEMHVHEAVAEVLREIRERFEKAGVTYQEVERSGKPACVICDVADELNVDVIVMGGPGVNLEIESSSTAASVIELASCPVLVVPT